MKRLGILMLHELLFLLAGSHRSTGSACPRCHPLAKCQPTGWCACAHGYVGNGVTICFDVDECAVNVCNSENEICLNTAGSYECSCKQGYVRLSSNCQKVYTTTSITNTAEYVSASTPDVSASSPAVSASIPAISASTPAVSASTPAISASTPAVSAAELSFNTSGHPQNKTANEIHASTKCSPQATKKGRECHCDEGYAGNGARCMVHASTKCSPQAMKKGRECHCDEGYAGNGARCMDKDECAIPNKEEMCGENAACVNTNGSYYCECKEGYRHARKKSTFKHHQNSCIPESDFYPGKHPKQQDVDAAICNQGPVCGICKDEESRRSGPLKNCEKHMHRQGMSECECKTALNWTKKFLDFTNCVKKGGVPKAKVLETFSELEDDKELASPAALCGLMVMIRRSSGAVRDKGPFHQKEGKNTLKNVGKGIALIMKSKSSWKGLTKNEIKDRIGYMFGYTEDVLLSIADGLGIPSRLEFETNEVEMSVNVINTTADAESLTFGKPGLGSIAISKSILKANSKNGFARVVTALYLNISQMPNGEHNRLVSPVISLLLGESNNLLKNNITYTLQILPTEKKEKTKCVFWDMKTNTWSTDGCTVLSQNSSDVTCSCNHLTNFAVLMAKTELSEVHIWRLGIVSWVGLLVSLACLLPAGFTFAFCRALKSPRNTVHMNLCLCLFVAELCFLLGIQRRENKILCAVIAGVLHYTFLAAFSWMLLEGICLYAMVVRVFPGMNLRTRSLLLAGYGLPAIVITLSASVYPNGYGGKIVNGQIFCWLDDKLRWGFLAPAAIILLMNTIMLFITMGKMCNHFGLNKPDTTPRENLRSYLLASLALIFVLGVPWLLGFAFLFSDSIVLHYIFACINGLQGLFIFFFHCVLQKKVREAYWKFFTRLCPGLQFQRFKDVSSTASNHHKSAHMSIQSSSTMTDLPVSSRSHSMDFAMQSAMKCQS